MINSLKVSAAVQMLKLAASFPVRRLVLIGSPEHGNLGDHAISIAERKLLKTNEIRCTEISGALYRKFPKLVGFFIKKRDVIGINGGGFLGSLWKIEDDMVNAIIQKFKGNRIVIFPQTLFFTDGKDRGQFQKVYSSHKDLHLFLREKNSYTLANEILKNTDCKVYLAPDMVLSLNTDYLNVGKRKDKVLLCLRTDKESVLGADDRVKIDGLIRSMKCEVEEITTNAPRTIVLANRDRELDILLTKIKTSRLLIADRLHAMIFAYITGTPCYVFDNISHKVSGVYEWIKDCGYIICRDTLATDTIKIPTESGTPKIFKDEYQELVEVIKGGENKSQN